MKTALFVLVLAAAACKQKPADPVSVPEMEKNAAEKYVSGLQADVKRAQAAKEKVDAANKKAEEARKLSE